MADEWEFEPARDLGLSFQRRIRSIDREPGLFLNLINALWWLLVRLYMRLVHRFEVINPSNLPERTPFVLIANHSSHLDVMALVSHLNAGLWGRVYAVAAEDHFFQKNLMAAFSAFAINALPMPRSGGGAGSEAISQIRRRLADGACGFILFPEGTRSRTGAMGKFRSGIGMLVAGTDVPVVPCFIQGASRAYPPDAALPRPRKVRLVVGEPVAYMETEDTPEGWRGVAEDLSERVRLIGGNLMKLEADDD